MEKYSDKMESSSFTLFGALKMKNINNGEKMNNIYCERHTNKIMVTVSHVATPFVVINKKS